MAAAAAWSGHWRRLEDACRLGRGGNPDVVRARTPAEDTPLGWQSRRCTATDIVMLRTAPSRYSHGMVLCDGNSNLNRQQADNRPRGVNDIARRVVD